MLININLTRLPQYIAALTGSIAILSFSTTGAWTGNTIDVLLKGQYNDIPITNSFLGWIISLPNLSSLIFCIPGGIMCDKFGPKKTLLFLTIPMIIGWLLIFFASSIDILLTGRFVIGISSGSFYVLVPMYASEIAEKDIRAKLTSFFQLFVTLGTFLSYTLEYVINIKIFTIICTFMPVIFFIAFLFQVDSPIYKAKQEEYEEAKTILTHLRGKHYDVNAELEEIKSGIESKQSRISVREAIRKRSTKVALIVGLSLVFFQQCSGSMLVLFYTVEIFASSTSTLDPKQATIVIGAIRATSAFASSIIIELFPRKTLLFVSSFFSAVGLGIIGLYYTLRDRNIASDKILATFGFMPILGLSVFTAVMSFGISPMPTIITAELLPPEIKGVGISITGTFNWLLLFLVTRFYIDLKGIFGGDGTFYMFAVVCLLCCVFAIFVIPETRGKSLEEIQYNLNKRGLEIASTKL